MFSNSNDFVILFFCTTDCSFKHYYIIACWFALEYYAGRMAQDYAVALDNYEQFVNGQYGYGGGDPYGYY